MNHALIKRIKMAGKGKHTIKINAILNSFRTILNLVFPLITFPYISRVLTVDEIGKYNFSNSIVSYFLLIAALGIDKYAIREGAKFRDDKKQMGEFASEVFSVNMAATIISYVLLFIYLLFSRRAHSYTACILIFSLQIFFTTLGTEWLYSIYEEYTYITVRSIAFKVISIALLFIFVRKPGDYLNYAAITVFATVGSNVLNFINARKICSVRVKFHFDWKKILVPVLVIFASNVAIQIYVNSDTTMLGYLKDDYTVGIYSVSTKIYTMIKTVLAAALTVAIPRLSMYAGKKMEKEYDTLMLKLTNSLLFLIIPAMVGLIALSRDVVLIIAGDKYESAQSSLIILSIAIIFSIFSTLFNQCVLLPYHRERKSLLSSIISAAENIGLNFILIPLLAENGAAITTVLAELTMAVMNYWNSRDITKKVFFRKTTIRNIFSVVIGSIGIAVVCYVINLYITNMVIRVLLSLVISVITYVALLLLLRNPIMKHTLKSIRTRIKK